MLSLALETVVKVQPLSNTEVHLSAAAHVSSTWNKVEQAVKFGHDEGMASS